MCDLELEACSAIYPNGMILIGPMFPFTLPHALRNFTCEFKVAKASQKSVSGLSVFSRYYFNYKTMPTERWRSKSDGHCDNSQSSKGFPDNRSPSFILVALNTDPW